MQHAYTRQVPARAGAGRMRSNVRQALTILETHLPAVSWCSQRGAAKCQPPRLCIRIRIFGIGPPGHSVRRHAASGTLPADFRRFPQGTAIRRASPTHPPCRRRHGLWRSRAGRVSHRRAKTASPPAVRCGSMPEAVSSRREERVSSPASSGLAVRRAFSKPPAPVLKNQSGPRARDHNYLPVILVRK